jgi:hypothetical protein
MGKKAVPLLKTRALMRALCGVLRLDVDICSAYRKKRTPCAWHVGPSEAGRLRAERSDDGLGGGARGGRVLARDKLPVHGHSRRPRGALLVQSAALEKLVLARERHLWGRRTKTKKGAT